jgi:hypothetical protein
VKRNILVVFGSVILSILLLLTSPFPEKGMADSTDTVISQVIYQVKTVLIRQLSPVDIKDMINRAVDEGATGYKLNYYDSGKMGWSIEDSKGREVYSVIFLFSSQQAKEGTYFGPLMSSLSDAKEVHKRHREVLSSYFKKITTDKYDIGDSCTAFTELFKGTTGAGRTKITVKCP